MDISIVILNYKTKEHTLNCIQSIKKADWNDLCYEIIVIDNNSEDDIGNYLNQEYLDVNFIQSYKNLGMGKGNNLGIKKAMGKYIIIMNPDTIASVDTFLKLFQYMESHLEVGIVGPKQLNLDGTIQDSCYRWHGLFTPIYRRTPLGRLKFAQKDIERFLMKDLDRRIAREVDWLLGSFLFIRSEYLLPLKGFDERYFMYFEDTDLCREFWRREKKVIYYPEVEIIHNHMRQSAQGKWWKFFVNSATRWHIASWIKYSLKWRKIK